MKKREYKKILWPGIIVVAIVVIGFGIYYFFLYEKPEEAPVVEEVKKEEPTEIQIEELDKEEVESVIKWDQIELDRSDNLVRESVTKLSSHPQVDVWLKNPNLIRKFVAVTDNIVDGLSPRSFVKFLAPRGRFEVFKKGGSLYLNPHSYIRYNRVADVFASLSTKECVKLYRELKPLIQKAYIQLGYPDRDFQDTLQSAIIELLETPVVEGDIMLERRIVTYMMVDPKLEQLSAAQKHLLRMGPRNVRKVQAKLREIALAFGIPESQLPQPLVYTPVNRR